MDKKFAIFDMDGTLVDSMAYWQQLGRRYLEAVGIRDGLDEVLKHTEAMTMAESAALFADTFHLADTPEKVMAAMDEMMERHYRRNIPLKPGVRRYLEGLRQKGVTMCVASATKEILITACLKRLGIQEYFDFLLSCESIGVGKSKPDIYHLAAGKLAARPRDIAVYEDALYAVRTAKKAGYYVVGVYDDNAACQWQEICRLADETVFNWQEYRY